MFTAIESRSRVYSTLEIIYEKSIIDGSDLKTYLLMRWKGPDALAVVRSTGVYLLDFFYSVLCTVESFSLLYLLFFILNYMF